MFLSVSVLHVGAHPDGHLHGVSIHISVSLGRTFFRISRIRNIPLTWILARVFAYFPPFISQILEFIYRTVLIFILIYFEWRDTENQQYFNIVKPVLSGPPIKWTLCNILYIFPFITNPYSADTKINCIWLISIVNNLYKADTRPNWQ